VRKKSKNPQEAFLKKRTILMIMTVGNRISVADSLTDGVSTTYNQHVEHSIDDFCYHNLSQHVYDLIV
jgi:hypothetical protein